MIRAGDLDRTITIERMTSTKNAYGVPVETWTTLSTVRAEKVEGRTADFFRGPGETSEGAVVFRIRHRDDIMTGDRIAYQGDTYAIDSIAELGRRVGLELRCRAKGGT